MIENLTIPDMSEWTDEQADAWYNDGRTGSFSARNSWDAVQTFESLLEPFGLQIGMYNDSSDYRITILPRDGGPNKDVALAAANAQLADALKSVESANAAHASALRKLDDSTNHLKARLQAMSADDLMSRALIMAQLDFATRLQKDIRGY